MRQQPAKNEQCPNDEVHSFHTWKRANPSGKTWSPRYCHGVLEAELVEEEPQDTPEVLAERDLLRELHRPENRLWRDVLNRSGYFNAGRVS